MRRFTAILLMVLLPLQVTWSAVLSLHGHMDGSAPVSLFHYHDHHDSAHHADEDDFTASNLTSDNQDANPPEGHSHPVFTMLVVELTLNVGNPFPSVHPSWAAPSFTSHIPRLFNRPPLSQR